MKKLSPTRARILRALAEYEGVYLKKSYWEGATFYPCDFIIGRDIKVTGKNYKYLLTDEYIVLVSHDEWGASFYGITEKGRAAITQLRERDFETKKSDLTAGEIITTLKRKYKGRGYFFREIGVGRRRVDAFLLTTWWPHRTIIFEIKVFRGDFLNELNKSKKWKDALFLANQFYFVAPRGLISSNEIPKECGFMEVSKKGTRVYTTLDAPFRKIEKPSWPFVLKLLKGK